MIPVANTKRDCAEESEQCSRKESRCEHGRKESQEQCNGEGGEKSRAHEELQRFLGRCRWPLLCTVLRLSGRCGDARDLRCWLV